MFKEDEVSIDCPIKIIHGMNDSLIPFNISVEFAEKLKSMDIEVVLVKDADHRFSSQSNKDNLEKYINSFIEKLK